MTERDAQLAESIVAGAVKLAKEIWVLAVGCPKHPGYRYKKPPTCETCQKLYGLAQAVNLHGKP